MKLDAKPDSYMPYYGNDFEAATKGFSPSTKWAYLCAIWHYWHHTHCAGLPDDNESLRRICEVEMIDWGRIKGQVFNSPFFTLTDGVWHQSRSREIYTKWDKAYKAKVEALALARESNPNNRTGNRTDNSTVNSPVNRTVIEHKPEPEPEPVKTKKDAVASVVFPSGYSTPETLQAWEDWKQYRKEARHPITPMTAKACFKKLEIWGKEKWISGINQSIANGWQGLFEPNNQETFAPTKQSSISSGKKQPGESEASYLKRLANESL